MSRSALATAVVLGAAVSVAGIGCRTYLPYVGRPTATRAEARQVIERTIEQQPGGTPAEIQITDERLRIVRSSGFLRRAGATTIYSSSIGGTSLSRKQNWYTVAVNATNGEPILHVLTADQAAAEAFIDAVETMRAATAHR